MIILKGLLKSWFLEDLHIDSGYHHRQLNQIKWENFTLKAPSRQVNANAR